MTSRRSTRRNSSSQSRATTVVRLGKKSVKGHKSEYQRQLVANGIVDDCEANEDGEEVSYHQSATKGMQPPKSNHRIYSNVKQTVPSKAKQLSTSQLEPRAPAYEQLSDIESSRESDAESAPDESDHSSYDDEEKRSSTEFPRTFSKKNLKRHRLSHSETRFLLNQFGQNPHPDSAQRAQLSKQIQGLSARQIQVWFQNRRAKLKRMSAADADRMLSTRSYPEGYGPQEFQNPKKTGEISTYNRLVDRVFATSDYRATTILQSSGASKSQYRSTEGQYEAHEESSHVPSTQSSSYARSPVRPLPALARYRSYDTAQASPASNYSEPASGTLRTPMHTPMQSHGLPSPYENVYGSNRASPAVPVTGRYARAYSSYYTSRPIPSEAEYVASLQQNAASSAAYASASYAEHQNPQYPGSLASQAYSGSRAGYCGLNYGQYKVEESQEAAYTAERFSSRPLGYNDHNRSGRYLYAEARGASNADEMMDEDDEAPRHQAPLMQRESKYPYEAAEYVPRGRQEYSSVHGVRQVYDEEQDEQEDGDEAVNGEETRYAQSNGGSYALHNRSINDRSFHYNGMQMVHPSQAQYGSGMQAQVRSQHLQPNQPEADYDGSDRSDREDSPSFHERPEHHATGTEVA